MPTFTIPDNFTITDAEFAEQDTNQQAVYRDEGGRQSDRTYVDALGRGRWTTDYITLRFAGYTHQQAMQEVRVRIRENWGGGPLPAKEQHVTLPHPVTPPPAHPPASTAPLDVLRAAVRQADHEQPDLRVRNTRVTCFELLQRALAVAGPEWAFVGKTADMDGSGKYAPSTFKTFSVELARPDGQRQVVTIVGVSIDAVYHVPTRTQYKALVNSTDGETGEGGQGKPAGLDSYPIDPANYRWHNPPVTQEYVAGK